MGIRKKLYDVIEPTMEKRSTLSTVYNVFMLLIIVVSIVPLTFKTRLTVFYYTDIISTAVFCVDYILRFITADYKIKCKGIKAFIRYPFTFMAIIDLVSILPSITTLNSGFRLLKIFRFFRTIRVVRVLSVFKVFKAARYSRSISILVQVMKKSKDALLAVCAFAFGYTFISALIIFNVENETFQSFFDAIYWAIVSLTTVGYGDIYPVSTAGRIITMISSIFGIAIIALPSGIITAGYMDVINNSKNDSSDEDEIQKP